MKELRYITLTQIIGCLLVILGHSYPFITDLPMIVKDVKGFLYMFHMPLFVFCSGFLFYYTEQTKRKSFKTFTKQRSIKLLIPYLLLSLIGFMPKYFFSSVLNDSLNLDVESLIRVFLIPRENIWGHFWFIPMIFTLGCLSYIIDKFLFCHIKRSLLWGVICIITIIINLYYSPLKGLQWFGLNDVVKFSWSFALGVEANYLLGDIKKKLNYRQTIQIILVFTLILVISFELISHTIIREMIISILMISLILLVCMVGEDYINFKNYPIIKQTYQIFILSWPCQLIMEVLLERILHLQWYIILPLVFASGIIGPIILLIMIDKIENLSNTKILSTMIGK